MEILRNCYICEGWELDEEAAARAEMLPPRRTARQTGWKPRLPIRHRLYCDHGPSLDCIFRGDISCFAAAQTTRLLLLTQAPNRGSARGLNSKGRQREPFTRQPGRGDGSGHDHHIRGQSRVQAVDRDRSPTDILHPDSASAVVVAAIGDAALAARFVKCHG